GVDVRGGTVGECHRLCGLDGSRRALLVARRNGVEAGRKRAAAVASQFARLAEAYGRIPAQSHVAPPAASAVAKYPTLRATGRDAQIEPAAIAVVAALPDALHPYRREPSEHARHVSAPSCPSPCPSRRSRCWHTSSAKHRR